MAKNRLAALLMAAMLLCSGSAFAQEKTADAVGTWTLPDTYTVDDSSYTDENDETYEWLFMAYDETYFVDVNRNYDAQTSDINLAAYSQEQIDEFAASCAESYSDEVCTYTYVETVNAGQVPFILFSVKDTQEDDCYVAETRADGWCVYLMLYNEEGSLPEEGLDMFKDIVASYKPV